MIKGLGKVYRFTLIQVLKNKSNLIAFGIMFLIAALAIPVAGVFMGGSAAELTSYLEISSVEDYLNSDPVGFDTRYGVQYAYSIIAMIICVFSVTYIVRSIVEEKVSRLVEMLMVSVKPLALVFGKLLAVMTYMFSVLLIFAAILGLSWFVTGQFMDVSFVGRMLANIGISADMVNLGPDVFVTALISLILAYFFFSLIAGLCGAGCSNMDEIENANMGAMTAILAGYIASCAAAGFGEGAMVFCSLCPVVSAFTAPAAYIFGDISLAVLAAGWLLELICIGVLLVVTARVYDQLILYRGSRLKLRRVFALASGRKGGAAK